MNKLISLVSFLALFTFAACAGDTASPDTEVVHRTLVVEGIEAGFTFTAEPGSVPNAPDRVGFELSVFDGQLERFATVDTCRLYTSDAADDLPCGDLGGRRIIKKKNHS